MLKGSPLLENQTGHEFVFPTHGVLMSWETHHKLPGWEAWSGSFTNALISSWTRRRFSFPLVMSVCGVGKDPSQALPWVPTPTSLVWQSLQESILCSPIPTSPLMNSSLPPFNLCVYQLAVQQHLDITCCYVHRVLPSHLLMWFSVAGSPAHLFEGWLSQWHLLASLDEWRRQSPQFSWYQHKIWTGWRKA